ncbi:MAG: hypothetical protein ABIZ04_22650 [Opitutus sp.]
MRTGLELFLSSFAALLLELALIRWLPERVRVIAYFPNLVLIAAFLGLGVGALSKLRNAVWLGPLIMAVIVTAMLLGRIAFTAEGSSEHLWLLYYDLPQSAPVVNSVMLPITLIFALTAALFIPLGGIIAGRIQAFKDDERPLDGYAVDLLGSLAGVVGFVGLAALGSKPIWWFGCAAAAVAFTLPHDWRLRAAFIIPLVCGLWFVQSSGRDAIYSPYYSISTVERQNGEVVILTNGSVHQHAIDLRTAAQTGASLNLRTIYRGYRLPIALLSKPPRRALVLGAGSGNDVTVLLDAGVPEIHAVEIDPVIIELGRTKHPARPYLDPRVVIHNTDARAFLENTDLKFDLIVFGTLDSMTRLSALSNVRLDNFVYTVESLRAARACLSDEGGLALMFMVGTNEIADHLFNLFWNAFGEPPSVYSGSHFLFNQVYFGGRGFAHLAKQPAFSDARRVAMGKLTIVPSDDWPYLYLSQPTLSTFYLGVAAMIVLIAVTLLLGVSAPLRRSLRQGRVDWEMMLLGAAFLLCETGFVTQMNLLFGATWRTSAIIFGAILIALVGATLIGRRWIIPSRPAVIATAIAIVVVAYLPLREMAPGGFAARVVFALFVCGVPLTFAGLVFASRFAVREQADVAFGWNVVGAVMGGILEMSSMLLGLRAVFIGAGLLYAITFFFMRTRTSSPASSPNLGSNQLTGRA